MAVYNRAAGELHVTVKNGSYVPSTRSVVFSVEWVNPGGISREVCLERDPRKCASVYKPTARFIFSPSSSRLGQTLPLLGNVLGAGNVEQFNFITSRAYEHNTLPGKASILSFDLQPNLGLPPGTVITLRGLVGFNGTDAGSETGVSLLKTGGSIWSCFTDATTLGKAAWEAATSSIFLTVAPGCTLSAENVTKVSIIVRNPAVAQAAQSVTASASFAGCDSCRYSCGCDSQLSPAFTLSPLTLAGTVLSSSGASSFSQAEATETTAVPGQLNILTLTTYASSVLLPGTVFAVSGLNGTQSGVEVDTRDAVFTVTGASSKVDDAATFTLSTMTFRCTLPQGVIVGSGQRLTIQFAVMNGLSAMPDVSLKISARAIIEIVPGSTLTDIVDILPLSVSGSVLSNSQAAVLWVNSITELTRVAGAYSILTVKMRPNFAINGGTGDTLTISGLTGTQWPPKLKTGLGVVDFNMLMPNCTCIAYEGTECTCKESTYFEAVNTLRVWCPNLASVTTPPQPLFVPPPSGKTLWDPSTGTLTLAFATNAKVETGGDIMFSFAVRNPASKAKTPVLPKATISTFGVTVKEQQMTGSVLGGQETGAFTRVSLLEGSTIAGDFSTYTVRFTTNFPLVTLDQTVPSRVIISGLFGYETTSGYIPIGGRDQFSIAKAAAGNWSKSDGTLSLQGGVFLGGCVRSTPSPVPDCAIPQDALFDFTSLTEVRFSFTLKNTFVVDGGSNLPALEYQSAEVRVPPVTVGGGAAGIGKTTSLPVFTSSSFSQSTDVSGVPNKISVRMSFNVDVKAGSAISLTGLVGSLTSSGPIPLAGPSAANFSTTVGGAGTCLWERAAGVLSLSVGPGRTFQVGTAIEVSVTIENPAAPPSTATVVKIGASVSAPSLGSFKSKAPAVLPEVASLGSMTTIADIPLQQIQVACLAVLLPHLLSEPIYPPLAVRAHFSECRRADLDPLARTF